MPRSSPCCVGGLMTINYSSQAHQLGSLWFLGSTPRLPKAGISEVLKFWNQMSEIRKICPFFYSLFHSSKKQFA